MRDTDEEPRSGDPAIDQATHDVVATWRGAIPGKDPSADAEDFARMRDGFAELAAKDDPGPTEH